MKIKPIIMVTAFCAVIFMPVWLLLTVGQEKTPLYGEKEYKLESVSLTEFWDGTFQQNFEMWFSRNYPLRNSIVEFYGQLDTRSQSVNFTLSSDKRQTEEGAYEPAAEENTAEEAAVSVQPKYSQYILKTENLTEPDGYKGTNTVVVGKSGMLYENGYINELYGYTKKYVQVTDEDLYSRADKLKAIQDKAEAEGKAFMVVISPSKAAHYEQYIPDWYKAKFTPADNYVRPYIRFKKILEEKGVYFIDSKTVYEKVGLTNTFPKMGIHWNRLAAYETCAAMIAEYERQMGIEIRRLECDGVRASATPESVEQDIFGIAYSGKDKSIRDEAIKDDCYYYPMLRIDDESKPQMKHMYVQGGSFTGDFRYFFGEYKIAESMNSFYYNNSGNMDINWEREFDRADCIVLEVNEQFVYNMGGTAPDWSRDHELLNPGNNIIDALYGYVVSQ